MTQLEAEMHHSLIIRLFNNTNVPHYDIEGSLNAEKKNTHVKQRSNNPFPTFSTLCIVFFYIELVQIG